jgi:uncharacterized protein with FMN-binding domain
MTARQVCQLSIEEEPLMAKKMPGRLVALSASAVATIYVAGWMSTQPAATTVAASAGETSAVATTAVPATGLSSVVVGASTTASPSASTSTSSGTAAASGSYADGTYSGTGTSRFGNVSVSVTIASGRITSTQITKVTTSYPVSRIASLPGQVISKQSASVNVVTGATYSSQAFKQAVQAALTQAQAASSTVAAGN